MDEILTEEVIEVARRITPKMLAASCAMSALGGAIAATLVSWKVLSDKFDERANAEIEAGLEEMRLLYKVEEHAEIPGAVEGHVHVVPDGKEQQVPEAVSELLRQYQGLVPEEGERPAMTEAELIQTTTLTVWDESTPTTHHEDEPPVEESLKPFIISHDEFYDNKWDFEQAQLVWYEEDSTLADLQDKPIHQNKVEKFVGENNLEQFDTDTRSRNPNIIFVCNKRMEMLFEITRDRGSLAKAMFKGGEMKHSDSRRPRKMRESDDN